jgi:dihydropteroate synthase
MAAGIARKQRIEGLLGVLTEHNLVMGVVNVTPDSFSDGGLFLEPDKAAQRALLLAAEGADLLDIGGESTRPGAERVSPDEQIRRVVPVIERVRQRLEMPISVDTTSLEVAEAAFRAGADIVNDVSGLDDSPGLARFVASEGGGLVLMHMRGTPRTMQNNTHYEDISGETRGFLASRAAAAVQAGVARPHVWIDPGIGFGKSLEGNLEILGRLDEYDALGHPVVIGVSRKSFLGALVGKEPGERLPATLAAIACMAYAGPPRIHRVHDAGPVRDCLRVAEAMKRGTG